MGQICLQKRIESDKLCFRVINFLIIITGGNSSMQDGRETGKTVFGLAQTSWSGFLSEIGNRDAHLKHDQLWCSDNQEITQSSEVEHAKQICIPRPVWEKKVKLAKKCEREELGKKGQWTLWEREWLCYQKRYSLWRQTKRGRGREKIDGEKKNKKDEERRRKRTRADNADAALQMVVKKEGKDWRRCCWIDSLHASTHACSIHLSIYLPTQQTNKQPLTRLVLTFLFFLRQVRRLWLGGQKERVSGYREEN